MTRFSSLLLLALCAPLFSLGCSDDESEAEACSPACGSGEVCQDGACVAATASACTPACNACEVCDTSGPTAQCKFLCGEGASCVDGSCQPDALASCDPACGECESCDSETGECVSTCGPGLSCSGGVCQLPDSPVCDPECGACETCDITGDVAKCVSLCTDGTSCIDGACQAAACDPACGECEVCDTSSGSPTCVSRCSDDQTCADGTCIRSSWHNGLSELQGPFESGPEVTARCRSCHEEDAQHFLETAHWNWEGPTPLLEGHEGETVGKVNLINNFCIAVTSNEPRCTQCHAGYGWKDASFDFDEAANIDCLVCHADPAAGYKKDKKTAGSVAEGVDLALAAQSVGETSSQNCGSCHFFAGGGDNVKKGDLGSALGNATPEMDAHLGVGFTCSTCHRGENHQLLGQGVHMPVQEGRVACEDCHGDEPHSNATYNEHAQDIACQTCHIPTYSRQQPTKMHWDWATAGDRTKGENGIVKDTLDDGTEVVVYDAMKGDFIWDKNVQPTYAWYDGRVARMTVLDSYPTEQGSADDPVRLGYPLATKGDMPAKIFPFKVMTGRQPAHVLLDYVIVPKLFGKGGFWAGIPSADAYTEQAVQELWTESLTKGALAAGQLASGSLTDADWEWVYTEMYLGINHEIASKEQALNCSNCHGDDSVMDFEALGYSCDPSSDPGCGSRR